MFSYLTKDTAWVSHCYYICRYVFRHDTACSDDCIIADRNSREDYCASSNPAPLPYVYGHIVLVEFFPQFGRIGCLAVATVTFGPNIV